MSRPKRCDRAALDARWAQSPWTWARLYLTLERIPFDATGMTLAPWRQWGNWPLVVMPSAQDADIASSQRCPGQSHAGVAGSSMWTARRLLRSVRWCGESAFPQGVNVGFLQVLDRNQVRLRVYERGVADAGSAAPAPARPWWRASAWAS